MHGGAGRIRADAEAERARGVWLWALDLAERATTQAGFVKAYVMPGRRGRGSAADVTLARAVAIYLTATVGDVPSRPLASAAGLHSRTVDYHRNKVEDLRDADPALDRLLDELEIRLVRRAAAIVMAQPCLFAEDAA